MTKRQAQNVAVALCGENPDRRIVQRSTVIGVQHDVVIPVAGEEPRYIVISAGFAKTYHGDYRNYPNVAVGGFDEGSVFWATDKPAPFEEEEEDQ